MLIFIIQRAADFSRDIGNSFPCHDGFSFLILYLGDEVISKEDMEIGRLIEERKTTLIEETQRLKEVRKQI